MGREKRANRPIAVADIPCVDTGGGFGFDGIACCEILTPDLLLFVERYIIRSEEDTCSSVIRRITKDQAQMIAQPAKK